MCPAAGDDGEEAFRSMYMRGQYWQRHSRGDHYRVANSDTQPPPHVICGKCYGDAFRLEYGDYSLSAKCACCGHSAEVYSG